MMLPIMKMLKKREQQEIAIFQDIVVRMLYQADSTVVLHGGTAVWRCFGGNRFSSDIDAYIVQQSTIEKVKKGIQATAQEYNIKVEKIKDTGNLLFIRFSSGASYLRVEINYKKEKINPISTGFEMTDGTHINVLTLTPEDLMLEKIGAYSDRRFMRDIYDIYVLSDRIPENSKIRAKVIDFLSDIEPPVNEKALEGLVYAGTAPNFSSMVDHLRSRFS